MWRFVSTVVRNSSLARRNSRSARPNMRPSSGSFDGPKTKSAMMPMTSISWRPMSNMALGYHAPPRRDRADREKVVPEAGSPFPGGGNGGGGGRPWDGVLLRAPPPGPEVLGYLARGGGAPDGA